MNPSSKLKRRGFLGAALVGVGGTLGLLARKLHDAVGTRKPPPKASENRFVYDVSEFQKTDPALVHFTAAREFSPGLDRVRCIATGQGDKVWVAGDKIARLFSREGIPERELRFEKVPHCLEEAATGELFVGFARHFEVYDPNGIQALRGEQIEHNSFLTNLAVHGGTVYLADAGRREIALCDAKTGAVIDRFGQRDDARGNPGFEVPSPYFDLAIASDGKLRIVNPGRLRIETYTLDGRFESAWGQPGMQIDRFCGCCNPVHFTIAPNGEFFTTEKGLARIKYYSAAGEFIGVVAGPEILTPAGEAASSVKNESAGGNAFDLTVDRQRRVLALDPFRKIVRVFEPSERASDT